MNIQEIAQWLAEYKKNAFDFSLRHFTFHGKPALICFVNSLTDDIMISYVLQGLLKQSEQEAKKDLSNSLFIGNVAANSDRQKILISIFSGLTALFVEDDPSVYLLETRKYPSRGVSEPETEKSIRASRDGFIESFLVNIALIRRRIRDPKLIIGLYQFGNRTNCDIAMLYLSDMVDPALVAWMQNRFDSMDRDTDIVNERQLAELIFNTKWNPYPLTRYSERVDVASVHLLQGKIIVVVDNSPAVMILPTTYFEQCKQFEEYTQMPLIGTLMRCLRYLGIFASVYLLPIWVLLISLEKYNFGILYVPEVDSIVVYGIQILSADIAVEFLRIAMIHSPTLLIGFIGTAAAFLLGQMTIDLGAYTADILLYTVLANLGNFVTPGYELSQANKLSRMGLVIATMLFGWIGFAAAVLLHLILLVTTKSAHVPYMYPLFPFNGKELIRLVFRFKTVYVHKDKYSKTE